MELLKGFGTLILSFLAIFAILFGVAAMIDCSTYWVHIAGYIVMSIIIATSIFALISIIKVCKD